MYAELQAICREEGVSERVLDRISAAVDRIVAARPGASIPATMAEWRDPADPGVVRAAPVVARLSSTGRYRELDLLGVGGMGEVRRVLDVELNRTMAMKIIDPAAMHRTSSQVRFIEEAQATAQLQHPGIVPVHDLGRLADGRLYFTMMEVRGRTLSKVIAQVHEASREGEWGVGPRGWSFRRLVDAFHRVCEAVAYAHERGVVHRDLKPQNVMVGQHGEVLVMDWGLAKVAGRQELVVDNEDMAAVVTGRSLEPGHATQVGSVAGTPAYMAPEQALGDVDRIDARSDVYALGAILYELLSGRAPYDAPTTRERLEQVLSGPPPAIDPGTLPPLPPELVLACDKAMARRPEDRFPDAQAFAEEIAAWLEGARRRERARAVVTEAAAREPEVLALRQQAARLREHAAALLATVEPWQPEEDKAVGWSQLDEAALLDHRAYLAWIEQEQLLGGALTHFPGLVEAHALMARRYRVAHAAQEAARQDVTRLELLLHSHALALPEAHAERAQHLAYLEGSGALSLVTDPPGAEVSLYRYQTHNRRLVPVFQRSLGCTPLVRQSLPRGSYLCVIRHPDRADTAYPVSIGRAEHWDGVGPGGTQPHPVWLPPVGVLGPEDCYVPAGWFWSGGDPIAPHGLPSRRLWVDGMVVRRFPVRHREYINFLDDLVAQGREAEALRHAPRERAGAEGGLGPLLYGYDGGRFHLVPDADGDLWLPDWPVTMVDWRGAMAFAAWTAQRSGQPWRLPGELEWEKAARGVDGRHFPWGDFYDPSWSCTRTSRPGRALLGAVDSFPVDESPFGVRGMGGNVRDWCADAYSDQGPGVPGSRVAVPVVQVLDLAAADQRVNRGGCWSFSGTVARAAGRDGGNVGRRGSGLSLRLVRSVPG